MKTKVAYCKAMCEHREGYKCTQKAINIWDGTIKYDNKGVLLESELDTQEGMCSHFEISKSAKDVFGKEYTVARIKIYDGLSFNEPESSILIELECDHKFAKTITLNSKKFYKFLNKHSLELQKMEAEEMG